MCDPRRRLALSVLLLTLAACAPAPKETPAVTSPATPSALAERWLRLQPPGPGPDSIWAPDTPASVEATAFGVLPADTEPGSPLVLTHVRLATALPPAQPAAAVLIVGTYDAAWADLVRARVRDARAWVIAPDLALVYSAPQGIGTLPPDASAKAVGDVLRADHVIGPAVELRATRTAQGGTRFIDLRRVGDLPVYVNKAVGAQVDPTGKVIAIGRRRPLLAASSYPLRSPASAWALVQEGRWLTMFLDDDSLQMPGTIDDFAVTRIELAYAETEVRSAREIMQPYYVFRDASGHAVYVPAVADPLVVLPPARK